jgi:hypothetical protein
MEGRNAWRPVTVTHTLLYLGTCAILSHWCVFLNRCGKMTILCFNKYELNVILNKTQLSPHLESFSIYPHT